MTYPVFIFFRALLYLGIAVALLTGCQASRPAGPAASTTSPLTTADSTDRAKAIIREAVRAAGLEDMDNQTVSFRFRDKHYRYRQQDGHYTYERWWTDTLTDDRIRDVLNNNGLTRYVNDQTVELTEKQQKAYGNSVNSVIYFAFMPWALLDPAVRPTYLGRDTIGGELLDLIHVGFATENGGDDSDDEFLYWFTPDGRQLKYLAYTHPGGKSPRLREAYNERRANGITVRDYRNFATPGNTPLAVDRLATAYRRGELVLLSLIDLEEVRVEINE